MEIGVPYPISCQIGNIASIFIQNMAPYPHCAHCSRTFHFQSVEEVFCTTHYIYLLLCLLVIVCLLSGSGVEPSCTMYVTQKRSSALWWWVPLCSSPKKKKKEPWLYGSFPCAANRICYIISDLIIESDEVEYEETHRNMFTEEPEGRWWSLTNIAKALRFCCIRVHLMPFYWWAHFVFLTCKWLFLTPWSRRVGVYDLVTAVIGFPIVAGNCVGSADRVDVLYHWRLSFSRLCALMSQTEEMELFWYFRGRNVIPS